MWKEIADRRRLSYLCNEFDDVNLPRQIIQSPSCWDIIELVVKFFRTESELIYPAKSYFVALVYAACLTKYFNVPFYKALNDPDLLIQDPYFSPYQDTSKGFDSQFIYDSIIVQLDNPILSYPSTKKTVKYFKQEFLVKD